ncbi:MAG: T9SS type A sorting domain-containing protein, partial [Ferruginibacter sp.]|nr:T9SS type A sorting domain-containing protein [Cytophagales bacterium]
SDGTQAGTVLVKDINQGPGSSIPGSSDPGQFVSVDGVIYFRANDGTSGRELWRSDGTPEGTLPVGDIRPGAASTFADNDITGLNLTSVDGVVYFAAADGTYGTELWKYIPTAPTTCAATGTILREQWNGIEGNAITDIPLLTAPASRSQLTSLEAPSEVGDNYGARVRGYICPPQTGAYTFWLATDDDGVLYLSTNEEPANKQRIAAIDDGWATSREWNKYPSQQSALIQLVAGRRYYVEVLQKDSLGGDNLAVGWRTPAMTADAAPVVVPGSVLLPFLPTTDNCAATGTILREQWNGIEGNAISDIPLLTAPASRSQLTSLEAPSEVGDNYGARVRGYICPPQTGGYTFWLATDDDGVLYLSTDEEPTNKQRIAAIDDGWAHQREWNKYPGQQSAVVQLVAGRRYYVEVLQKDSLGGDNLAVGWRTPAMRADAAPVVVPGSVLTPFSPPANSRLAGAESAAATALWASPNPFGERVRVRFVAQQTGTASLELYDLRGERVRTLYQGAVRAGDDRQVETDGRGLAEGVYLLRLRNGSHLSHRKLVHHR